MTRTAEASPSAPERRPLSLPPHQILTPRLLVQPNAAVMLLAPVSLSSRVACSIPGPDNTFPHQKGTSCKCAAMFPERAILVGRNRHASRRTSVGRISRNFTRTANEETSDAGKTGGFFFPCLSGRSPTTRRSLLVGGPSLLIRLTLLAHVNGITCLETSSHLQERAR